MLTILLVFLLGVLVGRLTVDKSKTAANTRTAYLPPPPEPTATSLKASAPGLQPINVGQPAPIAKASLATRLTSDEHMTVSLTLPKFLKNPDPTSTYNQAKARKHSLDNASMLLYFGAFLFIVSTGLFVVFADISEQFRTALVAAVSISIYALGHYLYSAEAKLKQVGETFVGIGMSILPVVGVAAYNFNFDKSGGLIIWFVTSVMAFVMCAFTVALMRNTFVTYMLLGSMVSLFMSAVGIFDGPTYYYAWVLAFGGILLQFASQRFSMVPELKQPAAISGALMVPLAIGGSLLLIGDQGYQQLAISLYLGVSYYLLQAYSKASDRIIDLGIAHSLGLSALAIQIYAISAKVDHIALSLCAATIVHALGFVWLRASRPGHKAFIDQFSAIAAATSVTAIFLALQDSTTISIAIASAIILGLTVAVVDRRTDIFAVSALLWFALAFTIGQLTIEDELDAAQQTAMFFGAGLPFAFAAMYLRGDEGRANFSKLLSYFALTGYGLAILTSVFEGNKFFLIISGAAFLAQVMTSEITRVKDWATHGLYLLVPAVVLNLAYMFESNVFDPNYGLFSANAVLLAASIFVTLRHKTTDSRWISTVAWLLIPLAAVRQDWADGLSSDLALILAAGVVLALSVSRAIARGKIISPNAVPLSSMAREASSAYLFGAIFASTMTFVLALASDQRAVPLLVITLVASILLINGKYIERDESYWALVPITIQLLLLKAVDPMSYDTPILGIGRNEFLLALSLIAAYLSFVGSMVIRGQDKANSKPTPLTIVSLATMFIAPLSIFFFDETNVVMPIGLILASLSALYLELTTNNNQGNREGLGGVALAGLFWLMNFYGVDNVQAYAHVLAMLLAGYAYWRHVRNDFEASNQYIIASLSVATLPLALAALNPDNSSVYAIWLLLENVAFMLLGMALKNQLIIRWGLAVSVLSVLYELREYGWALLAVLSIAIIAIAIYMVLKQGNDHAPKR